MSMDEIEDLNRPFFDQLHKIWDKMRGFSQIHWATVTAVSPIRILIDGGTEPLAITPQSAVSGVLVGDRVVVAKRFQRITIISGGTVTDVARAYGIAWGYGWSIPTGFPHTFLTFSFHDVTGITFDNNDFVITRAGLYLVTANGWFAENATGVRTLAVDVASSGGSGIAAEETRPATTGEITTVTLTTTMSLAVGDRVGLLAHQSSGGALELGYAKLSLARVSQ